MSIKISLKKNISEKNIKNYVLFADENFKINGLSRLLLNKQSNLLNKAIISNKLYTKTFLQFNLNPSQKIILIKLNKNQSTVDNEKKGAEFYKYIKENNIFNQAFFENNIKDTFPKNKFFIDEFLHGIQLKS